MNASTIIIGFVIFGALCLIAYLVISNEKDKEEMKDTFLRHDPKHDVDDELNDN